MKFCAKVVKNERNAKSILFFRPTYTNFAEKNKKPSPEYHDLGETMRSTSSLREYAVECRFMGHFATGVASDKHTAKCISAEKLLSSIQKDEKNNKSSIAFGGKKTK